VATPQFAPDTLGHMLYDLVSDRGETMPGFGELTKWATSNGWHLLRDTFGSWAAMAQNHRPMDARPDGDRYRGMPTVRIPAPAKR